MSDPSKVIWLRIYLKLSFIFLGFNCMLMSKICSWFCGLFESHLYPLAFLVATGNSVSAGQLLCGGLFSTDSLSNWCAAVALAHALQENATLKEQLLRVQLATSIGNPPVSLLQQCTNILSQVGTDCPPLGATTLGIQEEAALLQVHGRKP